MKNQQVESRLSRLVEGLQSHLPIHDQRAMHGFFSAPWTALHRAPGWKWNRNWVMRDLP